MANPSEVIQDPEPSTPLRMVWPEHLLDTPPVSELPPGYGMRPYRQGDRPRFYEVMDLAGFTGWNDEVLQPWLPRMLCPGWYMAIHRGHGDIVATAMALRDVAEFGAQGGEMGWVARDPMHRGRGLGMAVCAAATARLIDAGYRFIHLYTNDWRLPALKTYLRLGYVPLLCEQDMPERWRAICTQLRWPFTPEAWRSAVPEAIP
jgi:mycothiol synthase